MILIMLRRIHKWYIHHIRKHLWWRLWYKKEEVHKGYYGAIMSKCVYCHAQFRVNKSDYHPICNNPNNICPCKDNETLKTL
jgi:hypothetical protein